MAYLGIDVGTGGTRALVIDGQGNVVASASAEHQHFASPKPGWAEQDPRDWWQACGAAVRMCRILGADARRSVARCFG
jgi:xylulokinase